MKGLKFYKMIDDNNKYTGMQKRFYDENASRMGGENHKEHNGNPDYWKLLLGDLDTLIGVTNDKKHVGLDFGCGAGRNVINLLDCWSWNRVDGIDISQKNIDECYKNMAQLEWADRSEYEFYANNGVDLKPLKDNEYDFVMSTITLQHICVYDIRYSILSEMYRVLKPEGLLRFQMGYGNKSPHMTVDYYSNNFDAGSTNGDCDVRIESPMHIEHDLQKIGFKDVKWDIRPSWSNAVHGDWIYVKATK